MRQRPHRVSGCSFSSGLSPTWRPRHIALPHCRLQHLQAAERLRAGASVFQGSAPLLRHSQPLRHLLALSALLLQGRHLFIGAENRRRYAEQFAHLVDRLGSIHLHAGDRVDLRKAAGIAGQALDALNGVDPLVAHQDRLQLDLQIQALQRLRGRR